MKISKNAGEYSTRRKIGGLTGLVKVTLILGLAVLTVHGSHESFSTPEAHIPQMQEAETGTQSANAGSGVATPAVTQSSSTARDTVESRAERADRAPETSLKLHLTGIAAPGDYNAGYAIIRRSDQHERHFRVADSVYGLATLEEIHIDRVVLLRDGQHETLLLSSKFMAHGSDPGHTRRLEAKRIVSDFRSKLINRDGKALIRMFGFEETYRDGGFIGFTIRISGEDGARMLEALGVQEGDVVTAVNGRRFSDGLGTIQSLSALRDAAEVDVEIDRQGVPMFFSFELNQGHEATGESAQTIDPAS